MLYFKTIIMNKFCSIILVLLAMPAFSQRIDNLSKGDRDRIEFSQEREIIGSEYLYDGWNKGMLVLNDTVFSYQSFLNYNAKTDQLLMRKSMNDEIIEIYDRDLTGFSIEEHRGLPHNYLFLTDKDFEQPESNEGFYEVVSNLNNTTYLIKKNVKLLFDPNKSKVTQAINNVPLEFKEKHYYYLKNDADVYVKIKLNKKSVKSVLTTHSLELDTFIKVKKIKFNNEADIVKLANFYYLKKH